MNAPQDLATLLNMNPDDEEKKDKKPVAIKAATHFLKRGNTFQPVDSANLIVVETLPVGTYTVGATPAGFYYERIEDFTLPQKIYGDTLKNAERILATFNDRPNATGALLEGEKGSGKSMLLKLLSIKGRELGMPTIVINSSFCGDSFNTFIQNLKQPAIVAFDEFEKVYSRDDQESLLTILDGTFPSKKLFVLTVNNKWRIDEHMRNRPGRIFYSLSFGGLDKTFVEEYCQDNLNNKDHVTGVMAVSSHFGKFTFDMLKALVEEMNRYGEPAADAMKWLNIDPEDGTPASYDVKVFKDGKELGAEWQLHRSSFDGNPLTIEDWTVYINRIEQDANGNPKRAERVELDLNNENIQKFDTEKAVYYFGCPSNPGYTVTLTRYVPAPRNFNYF